MLCVQITSLLHAPFAVDATRTSQGGGLAGNIFFGAFLNPDPVGNDHSVLGKASEACIRQQPLLARLGTSILAVPPACGLSRATCGAAGPVGCLSGGLSINRLPHGLSLATRNGSPAAQLCQRNRQPPSSRGSTARDDD